MQTRWCPRKRYSSYSTQVSCAYVLHRVQVSSRTDLGSNLAELGRGKTDDLPRPALPAVSAPYSTQVPLFHVIA